MGLYDQFLQINQQGLDTGNQIAMQRAQQPTMADVFMQRFRQGGQDMLAQQKAAEEARMHEASMKNMEAQRVLQAGTLGALYTTPDNAGFMGQVMNRIPGMEGADPNFQGAKERQIISAEQMQAERLRQQADLARSKNLIDELKAKNAGLKPTSPLGKMAFDRDYLGLITKEQTDARETAMNTRFDPGITALISQGLAPSAPSGGPVGSGRVPLKVEPIEQGKADVERKQKEAETAGKVKNAEFALGEMISTVDDISNDKDLKDAVGARGMIYGVIPGSRAMGIQERLKTLGAQLLINTLVAVKSAGGAFGALSDAEGEALRSAVASLKSAQSLEDVQKSLAKIKLHATNLLQMAKENQANLSEARGSKASLPRPPAAGGP